MNHLTAKNLYKKFGRHPILKDLNLELEDGIYGLLGPNGAGKTTLLKCLVGIYPTPTNTVTFNEMDANKRTYRDTIGYLPQHYHAFQEFSVEEMLLFYCKAKGMKKTDMLNEVDNAIDKTNLETERHKKAAKLSGGMLRRLGIAQCLLGNPPFIVMDEPTVGLDVEEQINIQTVISDFPKASVTIMSSHIVADLEHSCDKIIVMNEGRIITCDTAENIACHAQNKTYEIPQQELSHLKCDYMVVKAKDKTVRIISKNKLDADVAAPTLEEGYLCLIKDW